VEALSHDEAALFEVAADRRDDLILVQARDCVRARVATLNRGWPEKPYSEK
jgi:hypothetical protein